MIDLAGDVEMVTVAVGCEAVTGDALLDTGDGGVGAGLFLRVRVIGFGLSGCGLQLKFTECKTAVRTFPTEGKMLTYFQADRLSW